MLKISENDGMVEIGLVTSTPELFIPLFSTRPFPWTGYDINQRTDAFFNFASFSMLKTVFRQIILTRVDWYTLM